MPFQPTVTVQLSFRSSYIRPNLTHNIASKIYRKKSHSSEKQHEMSTNTAAETPKFFAHHNTLTAVVIPGLFFHVVNICEHIRRRESQVRARSGTQQRYGKQISSEQAREREGKWFDSRLVVHWHRVVFLSYRFKCFFTTHTPENGNRGVYIMSDEHIHARRWLARSLYHEQNSRFVFCGRWDLKKFEGNFSWLWVVVPRNIFLFTAQDDMWLCNEAWRVVRMHKIPCCVVFFLYDLQSWIYGSLYDFKDDKNVSTFCGHSSIKTTQFSMNSDSSTSSLFVVERRGEEQNAKMCWQEEDRIRRCWKQRKKRRLNAEFYTLRGRWTW